MAYYSVGSISLKQMREDAQELYEKILQNTVGETVKVKEVEQFLESTNEDCMCFFRTLIDEYRNGRSNIQIANDCDISSSQFDRYKGDKYIKGAKPV